ncbi:MAG: BTAD domain-containing putative transcriptional regulator, partial [Anaerolineales bacterium]
KPQPRDFLAALLWPDYEQNSAYAYLRRTLWELNQILTRGWIEADREQVGLAVDEDIWVDTVTFENLIDPGHLESDVVQLEKAFSLYRDEFMTGFTVVDTAPFEAWQTEQVVFYRRKFAYVLENLVELHASAGELETAHTYARDWLALDTLNEAAHRAVMRMLAKMGDRTGAIRQYEACAQIVNDELGVSPQLETDELYDLILHGELSGTRNTSKRTIQIELHPTFRVPGMPTPFIGRSSEVKRLRSLITNPAHRLVTLIGPGGMGKTRLAIQVASEVGDTFADGIFFVPLAAAKTYDDVLQTVAQSLDFSFYREEETPHRQLINFLREKQLLLILDNFEHLLGVTDLVTEILSNAPEVKLILTSRVQLSLQGEQLFIVTGMRIPGLEEAAMWENPEEQARSFSAIQLFLDRAQRVQPGFVLAKDNLHSVIEICHLVNGMPLGIELAAAWLELLPPDEITAEIARSLDFLETDQSDVPDRQRSLRAVFESSWKMLSESERKTFLQLCVFVGSFSREAAQKVSGATLKTLLGLVKKSWLQQIDGGRFQLHELMRQYGEERLKANEPIWHMMNTQHAEYYAEFVAEQSALMKSARQLAGLRALLSEYNENVKAAWDWLVSEQRWELLRENMLPGLFQFGLVRYQLDILIPWLREVRQFLEGAQTREERLAYVITGTLEVFCEETHQIKDDDPIGRAGRIWRIVCEYELAQPMGFWYVLLAGIVRVRNLDPAVHDGQLENIIAALGENQTRWYLGMALLFEGNWWKDYDFDGEKFAEAANAFKQAGTPYEQGMVEEMLAAHAFQKHEPLEVVLAHYDHARAFFKQMEGTTRSGINMVYLWDVYLQMGEPEKAFAIFRDERQELIRRGNIVHLSANLNWEALHAARYSNYEHALQMREQSLVISRKRGHPSEIAWRLLELGEIYRIFGQPKKALEMYDQARLGFEEMNITLALGYDQRARGDLALQDERYSEALSFYQRYLEYAQEDNHPWSIVQAQAKIALAQAYLQNIQNSRRGVQSVLRRIQGWHQDDLALQTILAEPICLIHEEKLEAAVELASFIQNHHMSWNETKQHAGFVLEMASGKLTKKDLQAAIQRGQARDLESTVAELIK